MDRIGCFVTTGLWPERCVAGTARRDFAGVNPREAWVASCRTVAESLRCPCGIAGEPCGRPVVAAFGQARPRGRWGIGYGQSALRSSEGRSGSRSARIVAAPEAAVAPVRFVSHALATSSRAGAAYGCPGSGVGAPCLW